MYEPDPDDGDVLSAVLVIFTIVAAKTTMITSLENNDVGYFFLLTLTFYKVLCAGVRRARLFNNSCRIDYLIHLLFIRCFTH